MRLWTLPIISLCASVTATAALAQCPTGADLDRGILFHVDADETEVFRRKSPDLIESLYTYSDGGASKLLLGGGVYLLEILDLEGGEVIPGTRTTYSYPVPASGLPAITPGGTWNSKATVLDSDGLDSELHRYIFGELTRATFGACSYDMIPIEVIYPPDDAGDQIDYLNYFPELGVSILVGGFSDGERSEYVYYDIEVAR